MQQENMSSEKMNQQGMMSTPPQVISSKDAFYLSDMMSWNLLSIKKANHFAKECQDQEIAAALQKVAHMHQRHYGQILHYLENGQKASQMPLQ
ncbi:hypothetical protein ACQKJC_16785 [Priestia koreensis]|uniref:hypothetical protein n=1 Tax=Priestia koreensis TaxID=284581 RepID=UPI002040E09F|nr:hypothetical protein [Priestia koreensis]MCM3004475.1 hypothetical protein [Priestia koreensis]